MDRKTARQTAIFIEGLGPWAALPGPLYARLAEGIRHAIERGACPPGSRLPAERVLAETLALSRSTVVAAYSILRRTGLVDSRRGSGTWVRRTDRSGAVVGAGLVGQLAPNPVVTQLPEETSTIEFTTAALPFDDELLASALRESGGDLLERARGHGYVPAGLPELRLAIAAHLTRLGVPSSDRQILVTNGAQQAISLVATLFVERGEPVLVESPTYPGALDALAARGAQLIPLEVGDDGVPVDRLGDLVARLAPRLVYLTPTHHNPTGAVMPDASRSEVARLSDEFQVPVVDDMTTADLGLDGAPPPAPLAAYRPRAPILTIGSMSKLYWGGLRVGWLRGPESVVARLTRLRVAADLAGSVLSQLVALRLLSRYDEVRDLRRRQVAARLDRLCSDLDEQLPSWTWTRPPGGLTLWVRLPEGNADELAQLALRHGVAFVPGSAASPGGGNSEWLRLAFVLDPPALREGVRRLALAWSAYASHASRRSHPRVGTLV